MRNKVGLAVQNLTGSESPSSAGGVSSAAAGVPDPCPPGSGREAAGRTGAREPAAEVEERM